MSDDKACKTCAWAVWDRDKVGRRMFSHGGRCEFPIPKPLPLSVLDYNGRSPLRKQLIFATWTDCPCHTTDREAVQQEDTA